MQYSLGVVGPQIDVIVLAIMFVIGTGSRQVSLAGHARASISRSHCTWPNGVAAVKQQRYACETFALDSTRSASEAWRGRRRASCITGRPDRARERIA